MAKFTVFFKDKMIHSAEFDSGVVHVGSDETNGIIIDSLAVAPIHAAIMIRDDGSAAIKQLSDNFPLIVNDEKIRICNLDDGDVITIGKHTLIYSATNSVSRTASFKSLSLKESILDSDIDKEQQAARIATLQVTSGRNIGKIMSLKNPMTRLGTAGSGVAVITKRKDGYFVSALENIGTITVNDAPLGENTLKLNPGDVITVNKASLQFFY